MIAPAPSQLPTFAAPRNEPAARPIREHGAPALAVRKEPADGPIFIDGVAALAVRDEPAHRPAREGTPAIPGAVAAMITSVSDTPGRVEVRAVAGGKSFTAPARIALATPYAPEIGDRVVVAGGAELFVIGVLLAARSPSLSSSSSPSPSSSPSIALPCGGSVTIDGGSVAIADSAGRVMVRYRDGEAEIAAPAGDLVLSAPSGSVTVRGSTGVSIETSGTLEQRAERIATTATEMEQRAERIATTATEIVQRAERIATTATEIVQRVERLETHATRLFEHTRDVFRETANLLQTRAGRARTLVRELFSVNAGRTSMTSTEETAIDGSRVLIG